MDLRRLQQFDTLAETGSLHSAARRLGLSQPALSQSIRALEAEVGARLVERGPNGTHLTHAGAAFLTEVRIILNALDRAVHIAKRAAGSRPLRLGLSPDIIGRRSTALLRDAWQSNPEIGISVCDGSTAQLMSMLETGLVDLALLPVPAADGHHDNLEVLWQEDLCLALAASHPLAQETIVDLHRLAEQPIVTRSGRVLGTADRTLLDGCQSVGIRPQVIAALEFKETQLAIVAAGLGVMALTEGTFGPDGNGVVYLPTCPPLRIGVAAMWPAVGPSPQARRFLDMARATVTAETHPPATQRATPE